MSPALWRAMRPHQWAKNVLVFAAPAGAGVLDEATAIVQATVAFVAFCAASSAGYLVNDTIDREADRQHPSKATRPIAAGEIEPRVAGLAAAALAVFALAASAAIRPDASAVVGAYLVVTLAYSAVLKRVPFLEMALLAAGFLLRAVGGAVAVDVESSTWFLLVVSAAGVFVVARKRWCEKVARSDTSRPVLRRYPPALLDALVVLAGMLAVAGHAGWLVDQDGHPVARFVATTAFASALVRYGWVTRDDDAGGDPVTVFLTDRVLPLLAATWAVAFVVAAGT